MRKKQKKPTIETKRALAITAEMGLDALGARQLGHYPLPFGRTRLRRGLRGLAAVGLGGRRHVAP